MAGQLIAKVITVGAAYVPVSATTLVCGEVKLTSLSTNGHTVYLKGSDAGVDVPLAAGQWELLRAVDLATVQVKGTASDQVTVIGSDWF